MTDATATRPGTDPDRASFTTAVQAAINTVAAAAGIITPAAGHPGVIGTAVLATLLPARRPRCSARTLKTTASRYPARTSHDPRPPQPRPSPRSTSPSAPPPPAPAPAPPAANAAPPPPAPTAPASPP